jgi:hypothetical protein
MDMTKLLRVLYLLAFLVSVTSLTHAQSSNQKYRIDYDNHLLTLSAKKANLKRLLTRVAEETGILIRFPKNLKKEVTIKLSSVSLRKALRRLLKGESYALIYKGSAISEVYVVSKPSGRSIAKNYKRPIDRKERIRASIRRYENRLVTLKNRMERINENSPRGKVIMRQIRSTEKTIERLHKSLD